MSGMMVNYICGQISPDSSEGQREIQVNLKSATLHFGCRFAIKSYFWPLLCYDMRTRAIKNVFSVYKFPFPHQALKGLYAVCGPSI